MTNRSNPPVGSVDGEGKVRFYWTRQPGHGRFEYHWCRWCPWLRVELMAGAVLASSVAPPPQAVDACWMVRWLTAQEPTALRLHPDALKLAQRDDPVPIAEGGLLCRVCNTFHPSIKVDDLDPGDCMRCGCDAEIHSAYFRSRSPFSRGCAMAWAEVDRDDDGEAVGVTLLHCRCPGYSPGEAGA